MCYQGKCLYCIPVTIACLILAIINAVLNGLVVLWWMLIWVFWSLLPTDGPLMRIGGVRFKREAHYRDHYESMATILLIIFPVIALLNLVFSAVLCYGICNRRPMQVKIYFWYGVVNTVLTLVASAVFLGIDQIYEYATFMAETRTTGYYLLVGCALHSLFLVLVHFTHKKLLKDKQIRSEDTEFCDTDTKYLIKY